MDLARAIAASLKHCNAHGTSPVVMLSPTVLNVTSGSSDTEVISLLSDEQEKKPSGLGLTYKERVQDKAFHRATNPVKEMLNVDTGMIKLKSCPTATKLMKGLANTQQPCLANALGSHKHKHPEADSQEGYDTIHALYLSSLEAEDIDD